MTHDNLHVDESGSGPPLLLLHGAGVSGWMWNPLREHLATGVRFIVPDLPGFGGSRDHDYRTHAETVAQLATHIRQAAPDGVTVVGFSLGAQLAILLASTHPELVRGAVIVSGETIPAPAQRLTRALLAATAPLARHEGFARAQARELRVPAELTDDYLADSRGTSRATLLAAVGANLAFELPADWATVRVPVAVLVGANERRIMRDSAIRTRAALPHATHQVVDGAGHDIPFTRPDVLARAVEGVLPSHAD